MCFLNSIYSIPLYDGKIRIFIRLNNSFLTAKFLQYMYLGSDIPLFLKQSTTSGILTASTKGYK
jgi:hypothetical protein